MIKINKSKIFRRVGGFLVAALITAASLFESIAYAEYAELYVREAERRQLAPGITHEVYRALTSEGWVVANVVRSSRDAARSVAALYPDELRNPQTLSGLASSKSDVVAAINGDYFDYKTGAVLGRTVDSGNVVQSSNRSRDLAHFTVNEDGTVIIGYESAEKSKVSNGASVFEVDYINKAYNYGNAITIFDGSFGAKSPGKYAGSVGETVEFLVLSGRIAAVSNDPKGFALEGTFADGNYVIHANAASAEKMKKAFSEGDNLNIELTSNLRGVYTSISGGTQLVKDGKVADFTHNILGEHPRTAVGVESDGRTVLFVTVNGRSSSYRGIRQSELAELMIKLGAHNALILDGGGSATMLARDPYTAAHEVVNYLSDGGQRQIYNGLALTYKPVTTGKLQSISLSAPGSESYNFGTSIAAVVGLPLELKVLGVDTGFSSYDAVGKASFTAVGLEGEFKNGAFIPSKPGNGTIIANVEGKKAHINVHVSARPVRLLAEQNGDKFSFSVETDDGYRAYVPTSSVSAYINGDFARYDAASGKIVPLKEGHAGYVTFTYYFTDYDVLSCSFRISSGVSKNVVARLGDVKFRQTPGFVELAKSPERDGNSLMMRYEAGAQAITPTERSLIARIEEPVKISKGTNKLSFEVFGANQGELSAVAVLFPADKYGKPGSEINVPIFNSVDWNGWRTVQTDFIPKNDYVLSEIVLSTPYNPNSASDLVLEPVYFESALYSSQQSYTGFLPKEIERVKKYTDYTFDGAAAYSISYGENSDESGAAENAEADNTLGNAFTYIEIDNSGGFIRNKSDGAQWKKLISEVSNSVKPILIKFSSTYYFRDPLERELLLELAEDSGQPVILLFKAYRGETDIFRKNGAFIAEINDNEALEISKKLELRIRRDD